MTDETARLIRNSMALVIIGGFIITIVAAGIEFYQFLRTAKGPFDP